MKKWVFSIFFASLSISSFAALSPLAQSIKEINTIITSPKLRQYLNESEKIRDIRRLENSYIIVTNHSRMVVNISYLPTKKVGPQEFEIEFNDPIPLRP